MRLPLLLSLLLASCCAACPDGCMCSTKGGRDIYKCEKDGVKFEVEGTAGSEAEIKCKIGSVTCENLPSIPLAYNFSLRHLGMRFCGIPELACVREQLGARAVKSVALERVQGTLQPEQLGGLDQVEIFRMEGAALQTSVPYAALSLLPSLQEFRLHNAPVTLSPPPPPAPLPLHTLDLAMNHISSLSAGAFTNLPNLTTLRLFSNNISNISVGAFIGLDNLTILELYGNPLLNLPEGMFRHTPRLAALNLVGTQMSELRPGVLTGLRYLKEIQIMSRSELTLHSHALSALPALESLVISETSLRIVPPNLLNKSSSITYIKLTQCGLFEIQDELFQDQLDLETLILSDNKIQELTPTVLRPLRKLKHLDLSNNMIQSLPEKLLAGLASLLTFDASYNNMTTIAATAFHGATNLTYVTLKANQLTLMPTPLEQINSSPFSYLTRLQELDLSHNMIPLVLDDWRISLIHNIKRIDLSWNRIAVLKGKDTEFSGPHLTVDFRHNNITIIELSDNPQNYATLLLGENPYFCDCNLFPMLNYTSSHATKLNMDFAKCAAPKPLKSELLKTLPLAALSCSLPDCPENCNCSIYPASSSINIDCVYPPLSYPKPKKYNVTIINLKLDHLKEPLKLPKEVLSLNISHTNLTTVQLPLPDTLKVIDLSFNQLATIPQAITQSNVTLYIANNPLECICAYKDDIKMLLDSKAVIADMEEATCIDGDPVQSVNGSHLCDIWWAGALGGLLAVIGLTLAATASFIYYYNEDIKRFIYKQGWDLFIYEEEIDEKKYDVLVSYADDQEKIVVKKIIPILVQQGFRVTARYKDWDIGDWIPAKVAGLVEDSRRTLVILTRSYLESIARLEMSAARLYESRQKRKRMLVVVMDEAEFDEQDPLVDNKRCLKWQDPRFWEQLKKEMPKRREKKDQKKVNQATLNVLMTSRGKVLFHCDKPV